MNRILDGFEKVMYYVLPILLPLTLLSLPVIAIVAACTGDWGPAIVVSALAVATFGAWLLGRNPL